MAKETKTEAPTVTVQLFELSPEEKRFIENAEKARANAAENQPNAEAETQAKREALFQALIEKYPPSIGSNGLQVWTHAALGEAAYIEVAVNGNYFDPRGAHRDYRPDLDVPTAGRPTGAVFLKS